MARRRLYYRRPWPLWRWLRRTIPALALALGLAWLAGFIPFLIWVWRAQPPQPIPHADGIVALTGGDDRVSAALALLAARDAPLLLISGAGRGTYLGDFTADDSLAATHFASAIKLGHRAATTRGNAAETAAWARLHQMHSLLVVTADYHMPRALLVIHAALPTVRLVAIPVRPPAMAHIYSPGTWRLLAGEYSKYLIACTGLDRLAGTGFNPP